MNDMVASLGLSGFRGLLALAPLHLAPAVNFSEFQNLFLQSFDNMNKAEVVFEPCRVLLLSSPMDCLGWKFPSDLLALPSDTGVYSGCPITAHLALGFLTTFIWLGQQLSCQWSYADLLKAQPGCGFSRWLIPASQAVACPLYLIIATFSRGNSEAKVSCFLLPLCLSAQRVFLLIIYFGTLGFDIILVYIPGAVLDLSQWQMLWKAK